jgi:hypothetical protein
LLETETVRGPGRFPPLSRWRQGSVRSAARRTIRPARRTHTSRQLQGELFDNLANEEAKHKEELEKLYYETVHSGGV